MKNGISTNRNLTALATQLKQKGIEFVFRYYSNTTQQPEKRLTQAEARALANAGLAIAIVYEDNPVSAAYFSASRGYQDGTNACRYGQQLNQPAGTAIYFAVDYDASRADIQGSISSYFLGVDKAMREAGNGNSKYSVGVYGSGAACAWLKAQYAFVKYTWRAESTGWLGSATYTTWNVAQSPATGPLAGLPANSYEKCQAQTEFGHFTLPVPAPAVPELAAQASPELMAADVPPSTGQLLPADAPLLLVQLPEAEGQNLFNASLLAKAARTLLPYPKLPAEELATQQVSGRMMAYASPDSTYAVTKKLLESAQQSLIIGIYDFQATYIKALLQEALQRGVQVSLMLDTNSAEEHALLDELAALGADCTKAPSASSGNAQAYFGNAHEKIIVVDRQIVLIQSGNWSENSIPFNEGDGVAGNHFVPGNRDMGLAVESPELAKFFADLVLRDMKLARGELLPAETTEDVSLAELTGDMPIAELMASELLLEAAPVAVPTTLFSSFTLTPTTPVSVTPVVTPENFYPTLKALLGSARRSVRIEQQYIKGEQDAIKALLEELLAARAQYPDLDIRIIVSPKYLYGDDKAVFEQVMADFNLAFGLNYRYLSPQYFVHCHNKLVLVDEQVLVGSQNWSTTGVLTNREASLLIASPDMAAYFASIFDADWQMSAPPQVVRSSASDYRLV